MTTQFYKWKKPWIGFLFLLCFVAAKAQTDHTPGYDVGVFYMPFWHNQDRHPYTNPSQTDNHWSIVDQYDLWLVNNYHFDKVRIPSAIYYQSGSGDYYGPSAWYNENLKKVTEKHLKTMADYGIDFVIYDSFWDRLNHSDGTHNYHPLWNGVIDNWLPDNGPNGPSQGPFYSFNTDPSSDPLNNHGVEMALMWTEDFHNKLVPDYQSGDCDDFFGDGKGFDKMVEYWAQFMSLPDYKTVDNGRPLFYIYNAVVIATLVNQCKNHSFFDGADEQIPNTTWIPFTRVKHLIEKMNAKFKAAANLSKDVYFVAVVGMNSETYSWNDKWDWLKRFPDEGGFDASTTLRYEVWNANDRYKYSNRPPTDNGFDYNRMTAIYNEYNSYILDNGFSGYPNSNVDYHIPVSAGFDASPVHYKNRNNPNYDYPGYPNYLYKQASSDNRVSTPATFRQALIQAKNFADQYPSRTDKTIAIYAWNEHHEGTVISPTQRWGNQYLQQIKSVFGFSPRFPGLGGGGTSETDDFDELAESKGLAIEIFQDVEHPARIEFRMNLLRESDIHVQVVDLNGKLLQSEIIKGVVPGKSVETIDLNDVSPGIYIIRANGLNVSETRKISIH